MPVKISDRDLELLLNDTFGRRAVAMSDRGEDFARQQDLRAERKRRHRERRERPQL